MNPRNNATRQALAYATAVLFDLDEQGCIVDDVRIVNGLATVTVDRRPRAVAAQTFVSAGFFTRGVTAIGLLRGCRIEWHERGSINQLTGSAA
jgi:hypothetical protein